MLLVRQLQEKIILLKWISYVAISEWLRPNYNFLSDPDLKSRVFTILYQTLSSLQVGLQTSMTSSMASLSPSQLNAAIMDMLSVNNTGNRCQNACRGRGDVDFKWNTVYLLNSVYDFTSSFSHIYRYEWGRPFIIDVNCLTSVLHCLNKGCIKVIFH